MSLPEVFEAAEGVLLQGNRNKVKCNLPDYDFDQNYKDSIAATRTKSACRLPCISATYKRRAAKMQCPGK